MAGEGFAMDILTEIKERDISKLTPAQWFGRFAYVRSEDSYFDMVERRELSRQSFNAMYRHVSCASIHNKRRIEASVAFDESRAEMGGHALEGITFAAGEAALVARGGLVYGNRWRDARPKAKPADVSPWLDHAERMIPDPMEREHVLNVMAYKRQNPNRKINHAILHGGLPGSGKDTLWTPFLYAIGGGLNSNVAIVRSDELQNQWGYALESEVVVINELRQAGKEDAIALPADDRRWFVLWSHAPRMHNEEAAAMWHWYAQGGLDAVCAYLNERDVSAFNPGAAPPMTDAKAILLQTGMNPTEAALAEMIAARSGPFRHGFLCGPLHRVVNELQNMLGDRYRVNQAALHIALKDAGWVDRGRVYSKELITKKHVFTAPDHSHLSNSEVRRMIETVAPPSLSVVK